MNLLYDPSILAALLTVLAASGGYLLREWQTRARPFSAITDIQGDLRSDDFLINIPNDIYNKLINASYITNLASRETLGNIFESWSEANEILEHTEYLLQLLREVTATCQNRDEQNIQELLSRIFRSRFNDKMIAYLVSSDKIAVPQVNSSLGVKVVTYDTEEFEGSIWLAFPRAPVNFGFAFNKNPIMKAKCEPIAALIRHIDFDNIAILCENITKALEKELTIASQVRDRLRIILDQNSNWEFRIYLANLGKNPILVQTRAALQVLDVSGAKFKEPCLLALISKDQMGKVTNRIKATAPLVLGSGEASEFAFLTESTELNMGSGEVFRATFRSGSSHVASFTMLRRLGFGGKRDFRRRMCSLLLVDDAIRSGDIHPRVGWRGVRHRPPAGRKGRPRAS